MVLHVSHPTNRSLSAADRRLAQLCSRVFRVRLETMFNHTVAAGFSTLRFFAILPIVAIELTEYNCQSVPSIILERGFICRLHTCRPHNSKFIATRLEDVRFCALCTKVIAMFMRRCLGSFAVIQDHT